MATTRQNKVSALIQEEIASIFQKEMRNAFGSGLITVTHVFMSPDLSFAKTYLSIYGAKDKNQTLQLIREQVREIRKHLGNKVGKQLRIVPEVAFFLDESADYAEHIETIFQNIHTPPQEEAVKPKKKVIRKKKK